MIGFGLGRPVNGPLLVLGASGFVGTELVGRVAATGRPVVGTYATRVPDANAPCELVRLDVRRRREVFELIGRLRPWAVVNLAYVQTGPEALAVTLHGAGIVAEAAATAKARHLFVSTDCVYSGRRGSYAEDDRPDPLSSYGWTKLLAERAVREELPSATIVRTSLVLRGAAAGAPSKQEQLVTEVASGRADASFFTDERRSPIAVADLAAAIDELLRRPRPPRLLHVAGAEDVSRFELARQIAIARGLDLQRIRPASATALGLSRPLDCTLDSARARELLETPLRGVSAFLALPRVGDADV